VEASAELRLNQLYLHLLSLKIIFSSLSFCLA